MKKDEALKKFVRANWKLLNSESYDHKEFKQIKRNILFDKYKVNSIKDTEIAKEYLKIYILENPTITYVEIAHLNKNKPFLKYCNIVEHEVEKIFRTYHKKLKDLQEFKNLKDEDRYDYVKDKVKKEEVAEIEEAKKRIERELVSILDTMKFEEIESTKTEFEDFEWWEFLNLESNPFPNTNGFSLIADELFDKILVELPPYEWLNNKIKSENIDIWGKGYFVEGALGTGKTTFYDFFKPRLILTNIEPIRIILTEKYNVAQYNSDFELQLKKKISDLTKHYFNRQFINTIELDFLHEMTILQNEKGVKGFVINIDDLHKLINKELVFDFLSQLQLHKNKFVENGINICFFVSGIPEWNHYIEHDQRINSLFDGAYKIKFPQVTPHEASDAISKRLMAFAKNDYPSSYTLNTTILETIFKSEAQKKLIVGFRAYIDTVKKQFEDKKFDIINIKSANLKTHDISKIREVIDTNDEFKTKIHDLEYKGRRISKKMFYDCLSLLRLIYLTKLIDEQDNRFKSEYNLMLLKRLEMIGLIIKSSYKAGTWKIHPCVIDISEKIHRDLHYSFEDYLIQLYWSKKETEKENKNFIKSGYRDDLLKFKKTFDPQEFEVLNRIANTFLQRICLGDEESNSRIVSDPKITSELILSIVNEFAKFIIKKESPSASALMGHIEIDKILSFRSRSLEFYPELIKMVNGISDLFKQEDKLRIVSIANKAFQELWEELKLTIEVLHSVNQTNLIYFPNHFLSGVFDITAFNISKSLASITFFKLCKNLITSVEKCFKDYLIIHSKLFFGDSRFEIYKNTLSKLMLTHSEHISSPDCYNEFESMQRSGFKEIFINYPQKNDDFYLHVIQPVIKLLPTEELTKFYSIFIEFDKIKSHEDIVRIDFLKNNIDTFIRLSSKLIYCLGQNYRTVLLEKSFIYFHENKTKVVFGFNPKGKGQMKVETDYKLITSIPQSLKGIEITSVIEDDIQLFLESFFVNNILEINIWDLYNIMSTLPGKSFVQHIATLKYLIFKQIVDFIQISGDKQILIRK